MLGLPHPPISLLNRSYHLTVLRVRHHIVHLTFHNQTPWWVNREGRPCVNAACCRCSRRIICTYMQIRILYITLQLPSESKQDIEHIRGITFSNIWIHDEGASSKSSSNSPADWYDILKQLRMICAKRGNIASGRVSKLRTWWRWKVSTNSLAGGANPRVGQWGYRLERITKKAWHQNQKCPDV